ncbi:MAG: methyltransferase domain-containing protein [Microthrixaceae bacterium]
MADRYTHGHSEAVLRSHRWRTADNSAAHLLPHLTPGQRLLDVGCGPGNITAELAELVAPGEVMGIDVSGDVIAAASHQFGNGARIGFRVADTYELPYEDDSFDVVNAHQVLQHLADPGAALREMRRVLAEGGTLAVRDSDYSAFMWSPDEPLLNRWMELHHLVSDRNGVDADAGRHLLGWVRAAGFDDATFSTSTWTFATPEETSWWGTMWAERVEGSSFTEQAIEAGFSDQDELARIGDAFREWAVAANAVFVCVHGEVVAQK